MRTFQILRLPSIFILLAQLHDAHGFVPHGRPAATAAAAPRSQNFPPPLRCTPLPLQELILRDTTEGTGAVATVGSIVTVRYAGSLLLPPDPTSPSDDRTAARTEQFDESTISFKLGTGRVLPGCDAGIQGMKVGGVRVLGIPSALGFGPAGFEGPEYEVPPDVDLEYRVELLAVGDGGVLAEAAAKMGIGLDPNTVYLK